MELPSLTDMLVASMVGTSAGLVLGVAVAWVFLHVIFFKALPLYGFVLALGILFNYPDALNYTHPVLKSLQSAQDGLVILKLMSTLLLGYSAAVYHVGQSKCAATKAANALLFPLGVGAVWVALSGESSVQGFLRVCTAHTEGCVLLCTVAGSVVVAAGHYAGPFLDDYLSFAGCHARCVCIRAEVAFSFGSPLRALLHC